ncbi:hypothetical protein [Algoriphagus vanfongensis]|uniref:hypothetical protein n=1 Tax=Algoriphagus vanfongensis TaxID=426371 RepID=UPI000422BA5B|nr:hypothetical protein [Algoriphagus vanfongensis]
MANSTLQLIHETLLAVPGMNDPVKIDFKIPRKTVLLLAEVISRGMNQKTDLENGLLQISKESAEELSTIIQDSLEKAGLTELNQRLKKLQTN